MQLALYFFYKAVLNVDVFFGSGFESE